MSTDYTIHEDAEVELSLGEHSCVFDLISLDKSNPEFPQVHLRDLTQEQLFNMGIRILRTASYFDDEQRSFEAKVIAALRKNG